MCGIREILMLFTLQAKDWFSVNRHADAVKYRLTEPYVLPLALKGDIYVTKQHTVPTSLEHAHEHGAAAR
jgi:hypothetical protein